jgi:hypothetical protein
METNRESLRDRLLAQQHTDPNRMALYQREVQAMLEKNVRALRREKWGSTILWLAVVVSATAYLLWVGAGQSPQVGIGCFLGFWLIAAAVELLKHFINRSRVELLKEIKGLEMQVLELKALLSSQGPASPRG